MLSAFSDAGATHCTAHAAHNVVTALKKDPYFAVIIGKMSAIAKRLRVGYHVSDRLEEAQELFDNVPKKPPKVGATRWLGMVELTEFFKKSQAALQGMLVLPPLGKRSKKDEAELLQRMMISVEEWDKLEELLQILLPLKDFTNDVQTTKEPMAHLLLPSLQSMLTELEGLTDSPPAESGKEAGSSYRSLSPAARGVVGKVVSNIYKRFQYSPGTSTHQLHKRTQAHTRPHTYTLTHLHTHTRTHARIHA
eukprot:GHVU01064957.1.p1 GENE.GHVU01064957.1~~GHVU01064957.1.p1  ORF type:complete len:250 (-),score=34.85 GHVU01064957.1:109-858(-)